MFWPLTHTATAKRRYSQAFFDLQLHFAYRVTELSGLPLTRVLLEYTNLYIRFGLGRDFHPEHPIWQAYLTGLLNSNHFNNSRNNESQEWTYRFYLTRADEMARLSRLPSAVFLMRRCRISMTSTASNQASK